MSRRTDRRKPPVGSRKRRRPACIWTTRRGIADERASATSGRAIIPRELATSHRSTARRRAPRRPLLALLSAVPTCPILSPVSGVYVSRRKHTPSALSPRPFLAPPPLPVSPSFSPPARPSFSGSSASFGGSLPRRASPRVVQLPNRRAWATFPLHRGGFDIATPAHEVLSPKP